MVLLPLSTLKRQHFLSTIRRMTPLLVFRHQALVVLVVILLQDCAIHRLLAPTGTGYILLSKRSVPATIIAEHWNIFGNLFRFLHLKVSSEITVGSR